MNDPLDNFQARQFFRQYLEDRGAHTHAHTCAPKHTHAHAHTHTYTRPCHPVWPHTQAISCPFLPDLLSMSTFESQRGTHFLNSFVKFVEDGVKIPAENS